MKWVSNDDDDGDDLRGVSLLGSTILSAFSFLDFRFSNLYGLQQNVTLVAIVRDLKSAKQIDQLLVHGVSRVSENSMVAVVGLLLGCCCWMVLL